MAVTLGHLTLLSNLPSVKWAKAALLQRNLWRNRGFQGKYPPTVALMDTDAQAKPVNNFNCGQHSYIFFFLWSFTGPIVHGLKHSWLV